MAPVANLYDPFNGPTILPHWAQEATWAISAGTACATMPSAISSLTASTTSWSLHQSGAFVEVVSYANGAGAASGGSGFLMFNAADLNDYVAIQIDAVGMNIAFEWVENSVTQAVSIIPFDPVTMRWWRIREVGGTVYYDTSPDGATWTNRFTTVAQTWVSAVYPRLFAHQVGGAATTKCFDNFNVAPASSRAVSVGSEFVVSVDGELGLERCDQADSTWIYPCSQTAYNALRRSEDPCGLWVQPPAKQHIEVESVVLSTSEQSEQTIISLQLTNPDTCRTMLYYLPLVAGMRMAVSQSEAEASPDNVFNWALGVMVTGVDNPDSGFVPVTANDFGVTPGTHLWRGEADYYWTAPPGGTTTVEVQLKVFAGGGDASLVSLQARLGHIGWSQVIA